MRRSLLTFAIIALTAIGWGFSATSAHAQATRTWVSGVGDDANPCSRTAPCKTFAGAISKTAPGGEIDCLDPGGFGALTITKSITIDCQEIGSVLVAGTNGIVVAAGASDKVVLHGVRFQGLRGGGNANAGLDAIKYISGAQLSVDNCFIVGFNNDGIEAALGAAGELYVTNTYITNVGQAGIAAVTTAGALTVSVDHTQILNPGTDGFSTSGGGVTIGTITNSIVSGAGGSGVIAATGQLNADTLTLANNNVAVSALSGATARVSNSNIYNNATNFTNNGGAAIISAGNNRVSNVSGAPTGSITLQ